MSQTESGLSGTQLVALIGRSLTQINEENMNFRNAEKVGVWLLFGLMM